MPYNTWNCGWGEKAEPEAKGSCRKAEWPDRGFPEVRVELTWRD